ncbi:hypothetical protein DMB38_18545 [Streptomyces sp. WAC 06738]|nr:hypothetical protein DMB38_18545 [Streptomyces sp. WAC 06738]
MAMTPDDRRKMENQWHSIDLATAVPRPGDRMAVALLGEPITILRDRGGSVRAFRRRPRRYVRCVVRCGVIFVNLGEEDHVPVAADGVPDSESITPHCA